MKKKWVLCSVLLLVFTFFSPIPQVNVYADDIQEVELDIVKNQLLLESAQITDKGMEAAKNMLERAFSRNITEGDVAKAAADAMIENGSSEYVEAFEVIVASGEQSALPHGDGSDDNTNLILPGEVVVVDLGARYRGYCTDLTRTFFMGNATEEMMNIYNITLEAQEAAFDVVSAGAWARDVDKAARDLITEYGYGEDFTHGLGHGIGVYIHMPPLLDPNSNHILMESGDMAITIEPGIYLEGNFGVRTEDDVFITRSGYEMLTFFPKGLENAILHPENYTNDTSNLSESDQEDKDGASFLLPLIGIFLLAVAGTVVFQRRKNRN